MTVYLVGAGPGDPGLITVRGLELLRRAEVVVYDRLVAEELVAEAPEGALLVARDRHDQPEVNRLLVEHGLAGEEVVRLKGGDPFVFGRGGEEALALAEAGVPFEVVHGVSAIGSVPGAAGIPITHRGVSQQVTIATGQACDGASPEFAALANAPGTLVFFMGLARVGRLVDGLVAAGRSAETPAAVISKGTTNEQRVVSAPLSELAAAVEQAGLEAPALVVVGDVVALRDRLGSGR
ncbi:MAG: uroporphyrin-III C-methyltransferase [Gaiellaceae bacterium]|nr:uroporphyrin-III C-methyltransferase [Gaiellaceae bacterium]